MDFQNNGGGMAPRQMYKVDAKCADCGSAITELPFQPDPARMGQLRCRNCYKPRKTGGFSRGPRN